MDITALHAASVVRVPQTITMVDTIHPWDVGEEQWIENFPVSRETFNSVVVSETSAGAAGDKHAFPYANIAACCYHSLVACEHPETGCLDSCLV